jgi:predicted GNAT family acetyltransferase
MKIIGTEQFKKLAKSTFRIVPTSDPSNSSGRLAAYLGLKEIGSLTYSFDHRDKENVKVEGIQTEKQFRGHGVAKRLYQEFINLMRKKYHWIKTVDGDLLSKKTLHLRNELFGKPTYLADHSDEISQSQAKSKLLTDARESGYGLDGNTVFIRNKMPKRVKKDKLREFTPFHTQPELPFAEPKTAAVNDLKEVRSQLPLP